MLCSKFSMSVCIRNCFQKGTLRQLLDLICLSIGNIYQFNSNRVIWIVCRWCWEVNKDFNRTLSPSLFCKNDSIKQLYETYIFFPSFVTNKLLKSYFTWIGCRPSSSRNSKLCVISKLSSQGHILHLSPRYISN